MYEEGIVEEIKDNTACIRFDRKSACKHCPVKCMKVGENSVLMWVENVLCANKGDRVGVFVPDQTILLGAFAGYGIPTVFFIGGLLIAKLVFSLSDILSFIVGLISLGVSFVLVRFISRSFQGKLTPRIEKVYPR